jgi:class 3 adenylate cyclase
VLHCAADRARFGSGAIPEYVTLLSEWFSEFTALAEEREIDVCLGRRDGFVAAAWHDDDRESATSIAELALAFQTTLGHSGPESTSLFRLGLHTGPTVSAVIGRDRPRFDLWGEAVLTAESLAAGADPGRILVSPATSVLLRDRFSLETGRVVEISGLGQMRPHVLRASAHGAAGIE